MSTDTSKSILRRFFEVYPICCKIGGNSTFDPQTGHAVSNSGSDFTKIACNPLAQANMLNKIGTDINIIVGLCMGVDCVFTKASNAPVSTLFVKDKSLAHNPIGALYSDYYLKGIAGISAQTGSILALIEPVSGIFFDVTVLKSPLYLNTVLGCCFILTAAYLVGRSGEGEGNLEELLP